MHTSHNTALGQYRAVNAYGAAAGDRLQLVMRLLDGAIDRIATARGHMERREVAILKRLGFANPYRLARGQRKP